MGIQGLLPLLKKIHNPVNVSHFSGCTVAIDAYCWLHKGAFSCAEKLALGEKTSQYVIYCLKFVNMLLQKNIKPILVFDGCHLPSKKNVETSRRERRDLNKKRAAQLLREGRRAEARECLQRSIDISPQMALEVMNACRDKGVDCIVAPYEADAQLAYLNKMGIAQVIITEDSDLLLFGCDKVLFKMDHSGNGLLIEQRRLNEVTEIPSEHYTFDKFRYMCILSGCDYLQSLPGIGLVKANRVFKVARQADITQLLKKLPTYLKMNVTVTKEYVEGFVAADNTFLYQLAFDPLQRKLVPLNPYPDDRNPADMTYAGSYMPEKKALEIALGNICIHSGEKMAHFDPATFVPKHSKKADMLHLLSIWDKNYRPRPKSGLHVTQHVERPNLKGKEVAVKSQFRKNTLKRAREADDDEPVASNAELSSMYFESPAGVKQAKLEVMDDDLQRFLSVSSNEPDERDDDSESQTTVQPASKSPRFFNSLLSAHVQLSPAKAEEDCESTATADDKENNLKSPSRNRFALKSPSKRPRFDLNAAKVVKSRFFSSSKMPGRSNSAGEIAGVKSSESGAVPTVEGYKFVHTPCNTESDPVTGSNEVGKKTEKAPGDVFTRESVSNPSNCSSVRTEEQEIDRKSAPSPSSVFGWNAFKFSRTASGGLSGVSDSPSSSKMVKSQFKPVFSHNNLDRYLKAKENKAETKDAPLKSDENDAVSLRLDSHTVKSSATADSDCDDISSVQVLDTSKHTCDSLLDGSPVGIKRSESLENASEQNSPLTGTSSTSISDTSQVEIRDVIDLIDSDCGDGDSGSCLKSPSQPKQTATSRSGCRVSGLSKKSKKTAKCAQSDGKQQNLKDMFSKFVHQKSIGVPNSLDSEETPNSSGSKLFEYGTTVSPFTVKELKERIIGSWWCSPRQQSRGTIKETILMASVFPRRDSINSS